MRHLSLNLPALAGYIPTLIFSEALRTVKVRTLEVSKYIYYSTCSDHSKQSLGVSSHGASGFELNRGNSFHAMTSRYVSYDSIHSASLAV